MDVLTRYNNSLHSAQFIRRLFKKKFPNSVISYRWFPNSKNWKWVNIFVEE